MGKSGGPATVIATKKGTTMAGRARDHWRKADEKSIAKHIGLGFGDLNPAVDLILLDFHVESFQENIGSTSAKLVGA